MILTDSAILHQRERGNIIIEPFDAAHLGSNSYDVHLSEHLATYKLSHDHQINNLSRSKYSHLLGPTELDCKKDNPIQRFIIPSTGFVLQPNTLYLGSTVEYTETHDFVPFLDGKSSIGRLGIFVHITAGKGDVGFSNHWTLEIVVVHPVRIYPGMPIAQLIYFPIQGMCLNTYDKKQNAKYIERNTLPVSSMMFKNF